MNCPYKSIQLIDGKVKAVVNKKEKPNVFIDNTFKIPIYTEWQQNHEVFEFDNQDEIDKVFYSLTKKLGFKEYETELKQGIEVTCIEIKDGKGWFKEEKQSVNQDWLLTELIGMYNADYTLEEILTKFKITRK